MSEWREASLGEIADILVGYAFRSSQFSEDPDDVRLLRGVNIGQGALDWSRSAYWHPTPADKPKYELADGDVVLAMDRPWIEAGLKRARVRSADLPALLVQRVARLRGTEAAQTSFIHHVLASNAFSEYLQVIVTGATVPHISQAQIAAYTVRLPTRKEQQRISGVLDAIDELIENNRRRIQLLEKMAQAIYREWFVNFRFPGHGDATFVDSPLGLIPEGWAVRSLFDTAHVGFGFSFKSKHFAGGGRHPVVRIRDVPKGTTATFSDEPVDDRYRVDDGDVLVGMDGDFHLRQWTGGTAWLNQRVARLRPLGDLSARHLQLAIAEPIERLNESITGTTVAHLGKRHLELIEIVVPSPDIGEMARTIFDGCSRQECRLFQANVSLALMRDQLLPKLVSGEIDVSDLEIDALIEAVS